MVYPYAISPFCRSGYLCYCCGSDIYVRNPDGTLSKYDISRHEERKKHTFPKTPDGDLEDLVRELLDQRENLVNRIYCDFETNEADLTRHLVGTFLVSPEQKFPYCVSCKTTFSYRVHGRRKDGHIHHFAKEKKEGYAVKGWTRNNPEIVDANKDLFAHPYLLAMLNRLRPGSTLQRRAVRDGNAVEMTEINVHDSDFDESTIRPVSSIAFRNESSSGSITIACMAPLPPSDDETNNKSSVGSTESTSIRIAQPKSDHETKEKRCVNYFTSDGFAPDKVWSKDDFVFSSNGMLGEGAYGKVHLVQEKTSDGYLALKSVDLNDDVEREIFNQRMLNHKNIVRLYDFFEDEENTFMMLEYCNGGTLYEKLYGLQGDEHFSAEFIVPTLLQLVDALICCHTNNIIHCDIKLENIMIGQNEEIKLADFGLSVQMITTRRRQYAGGGTLIYMSPEMLAGDAFNEKTDVWSLGVLLYELFAKEEPFSLLPKEEKSGDSEKNRKKLYTRIKRILTKNALKFPSVVPVGARNLILKMLVMDPNQRISLQEIRNHAWVRDVLGTIAHRAEKQRIC
jgi:Protein kinase domain